MGELVQFPSKAKPRLRVPAPPRIVSLWAEKEDRLRTFAVNPCDHNKRMFDDTQRRYLEICERENHPA